MEPLNVDIPADLLTAPARFLALMLGHRPFRVMENGFGRVDRFDVPLHGFEQDVLGSFHFSSLEGKGTIFTSLLCLPQKTSFTGRHTVCRCFGFSGHWYVVSSIEDHLGDVLSPRRLEDTERTARTAVQSIRIGRVEAVSSKSVDDDGEGGHRSSQPAASIILSGRSPSTFVYQLATYPWRRAFCMRGSGSTMSV